MMLAWTCSWALAQSLPVESVAYRVNIDGPLAEVTVEQVFVNDSPEPIEAVYAFPLHERAAVDGMIIRVGDRVARGQILEAKAAEETYNSAVDEGFVAALTSQSRPNVFTQRVGNIPPEERVTVELRVVQPVPRIDGAYELTLPLVVGPRFVRDVTAAEAEPGPIVSKAGAQLHAQLDVQLVSGVPLASLGSPTHRLAAEQLGETWWAHGSLSMDRDFVLRWQPSVDEPQVGAIYGNGHLLLVFEPPESAPRDKIVPRELLWVLDRSCSMRGGSMNLLKRAMLRVIAGVDHRDRMRIVEFSSHIEGDPRSWRATPERLRNAHMRIAGMDTAGGTYLLDGVLEALRTRPHPRLDRYVVFVTDGLVGEERDVLAAIRDQVGDARLFTFGVGAAPNRWLLEEMSRFGGGRTTWLRHGEAPEAAVDRFLDTIDKPVLTGLSIDWADWKVREQLPRRMPALFAGQPLFITAKVIRRGNKPITVTGTLGDGAFKKRLQPLPGTAPRAVTSTWARQAISNLEDDLLWGERPALEAKIKEISLEHQVLSRFTSFLAVDRSQRVRSGQLAPPRRKVQPAAPAVGMKMLDSSTNKARYSTGNPNIGGAFNENTYVVDGIDISDPVTGTFSINFDISQFVPFDALWFARLPEHAGTAPPDATPDLELSNNLRAHGTLQHMQGIAKAASVSETLVEGHAAGPVLRDRLWVGARAGAVRTQNQDRHFVGQQARVEVASLPHPKHRLVLGSGFDSAAINDSSRQRRQTAMGRWTFSARATRSLRTSVSHEAVAIQEARHTRSIAQSTASLRFRDPLGGTHEAKTGGVLERTTWTLQDDSRLFGRDVPRNSTLWRGTVYAQDHYVLTSRWRVDAGLRADITLGMLHVGPRLYATADPFGDRRFRIAGGWARAYGHLGLPHLLVHRDAGLARLDELAAIAEWQVARPLRAEAAVYRRWRSGLPTVDGTRENRQLWITELRLEGPIKQRWSFEAQWRRAWMDAEPSAGILIDDGGLEGFTHDIRTDLGVRAMDIPWGIDLTVGTRWRLRPLGTLAPHPMQQQLPNQPRWELRASVGQRVSLRRAPCTSISKEDGSPCCQPRATSPLCLATSRRDCRSPDGAAPVPELACVSSSSSRER